MIPPPRTIALNRTGLLRVKVAGTTHCGDESAVVDGRVAVRYTVHLVVSVTHALDSRGFLVDQQRLHSHLEELADSVLPWREPCEFMALMWGENLLQWVSVENTTCVIEALNFTLSPAPHAGSFTVTFNKP